MQGIGLSQIALNWGCDDLDGTVVWYDITKRQGGGGKGGTQRQEMHVDKLERLIRDAGRVPTERDTLYRRIERTADNHADEGADVAAPPDDAPAHYGVEEAELEAVGA